MDHYDLAIIGTGSGNSLVTPDFDDKRVAIIEEGTFGGTCLNVGCIPTKMFVYAAQVADQVRSAGKYGLSAELTGVDWPAIQQRVFGRIDPIAEGGRDYRVNGDNTTAYLGHATFTGPRSLSVDVAGTRHDLTADEIVIATGAKPVVPAAITASGVPYQTSDTIMRIPKLPQSLVILGGGYIAAEFAHVFGALGVDVRIVTRGAGLLTAQDATIGQAFTELAQQQWKVDLNATVSGARTSDVGVVVEIEDGRTVEGEVLLVATGRKPNTDRLGLEAAGVTTHPDGRVWVDEHGRTSVPGVWSLGDASSDYQLKHVANHEARVVAHNVVHQQDLRSFDHRFVPSAVFSHPQIASVGLTEQQARDAGIDITVKVQKYGDTAYGWAMEDTTSIFKVIADRRTGLFVGAHVMGPQASSLIQPVIQAMSFGQGAHEMATGQLWIHPALTEVVENAVLGLDLP